ncbi:MAG: type II toxin-antitoxin system RelE/ParE family toxin [Pseudoxanthomonas sp.]
MAGKKKALRPATQAAFSLTRNAAHDLRRIYLRSRQEWGDAVADQYVADVYSAIKAAAENPQMGRLRQLRSTPFSMTAVRRHFIIYDAAPEGIVILAIQHQVRDIEALVAEFTPAFHAEVERLKKRAQSKKS